MDGMDPPENMIRCMANNYSALGFWRAWHRSYNLWIVRYLYIPLGGARRLAATSILIFTFVALWHDLSPRLLAWGWLAALFILPEVVARKTFPQSLVRGFSALWIEARFLMFFVMCSLGTGGGTAMPVRLVGCSTFC
jgi:D-alanyl-lipoteichoic acid acyltransferase DltB (MBOAT superfamily)